MPVLDTGLAELIRSALKEAFTHVNFDVTGDEFKAGLLEAQKVCASKPVECR